MEQYFFTAMMAIAGMIGIVSLILGLERMIRIIMANYFISSLLLAFNNFIDLISSVLFVAKPERWVDGLQNWLSTILVAGKPTILLTIYFVLLLFLLGRTRISFGKAKTGLMHIILTIVFLPCTILSILLAVAIAIFGWKIVSLEGLRLIAYSVSKIPYAYEFVMLTPLRIIVPALVTLLVAILVLRMPDSGNNDITIELEHSDHK